MVLAVLPVLGWAADPQLDAARQCTQLKDSLQRLVCYDKALMEGPAAPATAPVTRAAPASPARSVAPAPAPAAPAVVATPAPVAAPALGDESVKTRKQRSIPEEPTSLEAKVTEAREIRQATYRLTLDNGQVWQQMDMSSIFQVAAGDTVRIEKGALGGFRMARVSNGRSGWVRVARVQ
jgi:hypothetical protein